MHGVPTCEAHDLAALCAFGDNNEELCSAWGHMLHHLQSPMTFKVQCLSTLVHGPDKVVNVMFAVASLAALNEVEALLGQAARGRVQLEGPQEVAGLLEGRASGVDLMDQVLNADDVVLA